MPEKVSRKQIAEQIKSISNATETIKVAIAEMPDCTAKKSFTNSLENLEKKIQKFGGEGKERFHLSDEEKEYILKMRAEKADSEVSEIPADDNSESGNDSVKTEIKSKKGRKN